MAKLLLKDLDEVFSGRKGLLFQLVRFLGILYTLTSLSDVLRNHNIWWSLNVEVQGLIDIFQVSSSNEFRFVLVVAATISAIISLRLEPGI